MHRRSALAAVLPALALACASPPPAPTIDAPVLAPTAREKVVIDHVVTLLDTSSSVDRDSLFRQEKALLESFARSMPEGSYQSGAIGFGGFQRTTDELASFDRSRSVGFARALPHLAEGTPIHKALGEAAAQLAGRTGRAAVILFSDGALTDEIGRDLDSQLAFDAVARIRESYGGPVCLHAVQLGNDPAGGELLSRLSETSSCGSFRRADGIASVAALQQFEREVFLGAAPTPAVAAAPGDLDGDGVIDANDKCPGSPRGAAVDERGCWVVKGLLYATDSAAIYPAGAKALDEVAQVLRANPELRVSVAGHTDAQGSEAYNRALSERRARAARDYLVKAGIAANRVESQGYGESQPVADNGSSEGRQANRRTEVRILR